MNIKATKFSRRDFLRTAGLAAAATALTACGVKPASLASGNQGPVQLVYQDWRTEWFPGLAQEMLAKFNASHPNIRVFYTPDPENLVQKMPEMALDRPRRLCWLLRILPSWANAGYMLDSSPSSRLTWTEPPSRIGHANTKPFFCGMA
jgi:ABC-type glycerol-3-phosphate transport system substrate-binding protein